MISWIAFLRAVGPFLFGVNSELSGIQPKDFVDGYQFLTDGFLTIGPKFYFYGKNYPNGIAFQIQEPQPFIKKEANTKIITHGYSGSKEQIEVIVNEYVKQENVNILVFDWTFLANLPEAQAATSAIYLGNLVGHLISTMIWNYGVEPEKIHLIGYSMGAHLMGAAARFQPKKIGRITGLDPHRRFYDSFIFGFLRLRADDARFVDVYHTNGGKTGIAKPIGTADFFPNGGEAQPKCKGEKSELCNSLMANEYFAESINQKESFWGVQCGSYDDFMNKLCEGKPMTVAGEFGNPTAHGKFFYQTNSKSPYGLGISGAAPGKQD